MRDWAKGEPIVIVEGEGAVLTDAHGKQYLDANASIWTNLHGHRNPVISGAISTQLGKIAHSSALGLANEPASLLGERLIAAAKLEGLRSGSEQSKGGPGASGNALSVSSRLIAQPTTIGPELTRVFFSDDGSTAMEVALKLAYECARRSGISVRPRFLSLDGAYHGDTVGAVSLGHIDLFHKTYSGLLFETDKVMAPYCYRCPYNRAAPERADARDYRVCQWECLGLIEEKFAAAEQSQREPYAAFIVEPIMQGAAGMVPQPAGWLRRAAEICRGHGSLMIADEVMTGFGRTGGPSLFACHQEGVQPDFMALAKGLTGGYLPMAATLTTDRVFEVFLGEYDEFKTFFHGHSFTGNQLGAAAALASLGLLQKEGSLEGREALGRTLKAELQQLWQLPQVGDIRVAGLVAGIELVKDWRTREPYELRERTGIRVCEAMAAKGVLTRPIGNVVPLILPYCVTGEQVRKIVSALGEAISGLVS
jgi:adenosylmethionine-8-amino-7-oxononanoate aminotransferase